MGLANYTELKVSVADYLNRNNLTSRIPDFITLAEGRLNRDIRARVNYVRSETTTTGGQAFYNLPSDLIELRDVTYDTASNSYALAYMSPESASREYGSHSNGSPKSYSSLGKNFKICPTPDGSYTVGINYYQKLTPLSDSNLTNNILAEFPNLYLYGSCLEGAVYLDDNEQVKRFAELYRSDLADVKAAEEAARYSGTVLTMTVQGDPGGLVRRGA
jgi:hypothetical protein